MTDFMRRVALGLLALLCLSLPAGALQLIVWDPQLQTKLGFGEVSGGRLNLQLVGEYSGPVVALFTRDAAEKSSYPGLQPRYDGTLRGGQLSLNTPDSTPITRFLGGYKLNLNLQNAPRPVTLPGLKGAPLNSLPANRPDGGKTEPSRTTAP